MGESNRRINVVFVGRQTRELRKDRFVRHLRNSQFLSADVSHSSATRVNIPSGKPIPDEYAFDFPAVDDAAWCNILVFKQPLEQNWFVRTNFGEIWHDSRETLVVSVTTFELDDFAFDAKVSLEKALAGNALRGAVSADYVKSGGKFWDLYSRFSEDGAFAFNKEKSEIVEKLIRGRLGDRARLALGASGYTDEQISQLEYDFSKLSQSFSDRLSAVAQKNRDIIVSAVFFALGILAALPFS